MSRIEAIKHRDRRKNIPTEELRDFVREEEQRPMSVQYARDESLDPQLVWKGKEAQNRQSLEVPAAPIYIQEKIHPQAIIGGFQKTASRQAYAGPDLYNDFNGIGDDFERKLAFYSHQDDRQRHWSNRI